MLAESVYRTEDVEPPDRFDYWRQQLARMSAPFEGRTDPDDFRAELRVVPLGELQLWTMECQPILVRRSPRLVRPSDSEPDHLSPPFGDAAPGARADGGGEFRPQCLVLQDCAQPGLLRVITDDPRQRTCRAGAVVPRQAVPLTPDKDRRLTDRRMPGREGVGALLVQFLAGVAADTGVYRRPAPGPGRRSAGGRRRHRGPRGPARRLLDDRLTVPPRVLPAG
ncbi:AraC-like ligand-binding domain-containing protein [Kitasatospora sp. NPDC054939]